MSIFIGAVPADSIKAGGSPVASKLADRSAGLVFFHVVTRVVRYRAFWVQTAVRVLGSWIAATGLLVLVLEWAGSR